MSGGIDRREFLAALPGVGLAARELAARPVGGGARLEAVGVQLYTVRDALAEDLDATLAALSEIGYTEVELFGPYSRGGRELRERLDAHGLRAPSSHVGMNEVRSDWERLLEISQEHGQTQIIVPSLPGDARDADGLRRMADELNTAGEGARAAGLRFGFHNHDFEMRPLDGSGERPIDILMDGTDPELFDWSMDIFWTVHGGADPMEELERRRGRVRSVHVKDRTADGRMVDVGAGVIDFGAILASADAQGLRHQFVEHDRPEDPIESVRVSYRALRGMIG